MAVTSPWMDAAVVRAAFDIACDVRTLDPNAVVSVEMLQQVPLARIADLVITLAYLVDIDRPYSQVIAEVGEIRADDTARMRPCCTVGHPADQYGYWGRGTNRAQRCRQCDREIALRAAEQRKRAEVPAA